MKHFAALFTALDQTTKTNEKVAALAQYFEEAPEADRLWTIALLSGRRPKRTVTTTRLRECSAGRNCARLCRAMSVPRRTTIPCIPPSTCATI